MILSFSAKCSDLFSGSITDDDGATREIVSDNGYVPEDMGIGGGDYITMEIDLKSGQIVDWKQPSTDMIEALFERPRRRQRGY